MHLPNCTVWAFGSRVNGNAKPTSDLDLAIDSPDGPLDLTIIGSVAEAFDESMLPMKVDVVDYRQISPAFRTIIDKQRLLIDPHQTTQPVKQ